jgi:hypothetical protein
VATVENMTMRAVLAAAPQMPISGQFTLPCATPTLGTDFWGTRVRVTAPTNGMGHVGVAGYVPGSRTWSPPI